MCRGSAQLRPEIRQAALFAMKFEFVRFIPSYARSLRRHRSEVGAGVRVRTKKKVMQHLATSRTRKRSGNCCEWRVRGSNHELCTARHSYVMIKCKADDTAWSVELKTRAAASGACASLLADRSSKAWPKSLHGSAFNSNSKRRTLRRWRGRVV